MARHHLRQHLARLPVRGTESLVKQRCTRARYDTWPVPPHLYRAPLIATSSGDGARRRAIPTFSQQRTVVASGRLEFRMSIPKTGA